MLLSPNDPRRSLFLTVPALTGRKFLKKSTKNMSGFERVGKHGKKWMGGIGVLCLICAVLVGLFLRPPKNLAKDFPDTHPYTYRINLEGKEFPVGSADDKEYVTFVFGMDADKPVTYPDEVPAQIYPGNSGTANFDSKFALDASGQKVTPHCV